MIDDSDLFGKPIGTINQIIDLLNENGIKYSFFTEPDLQDAVTAVCFICDERVFNRKKYPDFNTYVLNSMEDVLLHPEIYKYVYDSGYAMDYYKWSEMIGGDDNIFLRNLIKDKRLA